MTAFRIFGNFWLFNQSLGSYFLTLHHLVKNIFKLILSQLNSNIYLQIDWILKNGQINQGIVDWQSNRLKKSDWIQSTHLKHLN